MSKVNNPAHVEAIHGKLSKKSDTYFYCVNGVQYARSRKEGYQRHQSPRQMWNSHAFRFAHQQLHLMTSEEDVRRYTTEWQDAMRIGPNDRIYVDAKAWKFAQLQYTWKLDHPFEQWYTEYLQTITDTAAQKTASETTSEYMLRRQIALLQSEINRLSAQLKSCRNR